MNLLQSIAFLGVLLIAISLVIDGVQRTMMKGGKRVAGVLQLAAILIGIIGFFYHGYPSNKKYCDGKHITYFCADFISYLSYCSFCNKI